MYLYSLVLYPQHENHEDRGGGCRVQKTFTFLLFGCTAASSSTVLLLPLVAYVLLYRLIVNLMRGA